MDALWWGIKIVIDTEADPAVLRLESRDALGTPTAAEIRLIDLRDALGALPAARPALMSIQDYNESRLCPVLRTGVECPDCPGSELIRAFPHEILPVYPPQVRLTCPKCWGVHRVNA